MIRVLSVSDSFTPGFRGGGTRHAITIVERLGQRLSFWVLTKDRDVGADAPYSLPPDTWLQRGHAHAYYASPAGRSLRALARAIATADPDVVVINSVFSRLSMVVMALRRFGMIRRTLPVMLSPEGEFGRNALATRHGRKRAFLAVADLCGLYRGVTWRATTPAEAVDIRQWRGAAADIVTVPLMTHAVVPATATSLPKTPGSLRLLYLSRLSPEKNLLFLLKLLAATPLPVALDIVGPILDHAYWDTCQAMISQMPSLVHVQYLGEAAPDAVAGHFDGAHAFVLPTRGESFGLAILESLTAGRPVLISQETPWRTLEQRYAGWDLPLTDSAAWVTALRALVAMDATEYARWTTGAQSAAREYFARNAAEDALATALEQLSARSTHRR